MYIYGGKVMIGSENFDWSNSAGWWRVLSYVACYRGIVLVPSFIWYKYLYSSALILPELFPNSFPDVNIVCLRNPSVSLRGRKGGTKISVGCLWSYQIQKLCCQKKRYSTFAKISYLLNISKILSVFLNTFATQTIWLLKRFWSLSNHVRRSMLILL